MTTKDIKLKSNPNIGSILDEYCENVGAIPTKAGKQFFREWNTKVPAKLIRQCVFAGIFWAKKHPEDVVVTEVSG